MYVVKGLKHTERGYGSLNNGGSCKQWHLGQSGMNGKVVVSYCHGPMMWALLS